MRKTFLIAAIVAAMSVSGPAFSQMEDRGALDLSDIEKRIQEQGLPTAPRVDAAWEKAHKLFESGACDQAAPLLKKFSRDANALSNYIAVGLEPFYGASYDDRDRFHVTDELVSAERRANVYRELRNRAMVMIAECAVKAGRHNEAATWYYRALELIDIKNADLWERARKGLYGLISFTPR
jgi:Asp-tRNA(Asn)/Glu-tRNA(Gln) amidotransferase A subunit family amidase